MASSSQKRARKQDQAIAALLEQPTISKAAKKAGVGERTLLRWLKLDDFQLAYRIARRALVSQAIAHLQQTTGKAVETLRLVMKDKSAPASAKVAAARIALDLAFKAIETEDVEQRLKALEQRFEEIQQNSPLSSGEVAR